MRFLAILSTVFCLPMIILYKQKPD